MTILLRQKPLPQVVRQIVQRDNGAWFDPEDLSTMFQDAAGTIPVTAVEQPVGLMLDKSGNGYHATQSITASRPTLSARYNLLTKTEDFSNSAWAKDFGGVGSTPVVTQNYATAPDGTMTATRIVYALNGGTASTDYSRVYQTVTLRANTQTSLGVWVKSANGQTKDISISMTGSDPKVVSVGVDWVFVSNNMIRSDTNYLLRFELRGTYGVSDSADILIWHPDLRIGTTSGPYQRVNTSADYDSVGFPKYIKAEGVDDHFVLPYLGLYNNASCSIIASHSSSSQAANGVIVSEASSTDADTKYLPYRQLASAGNVDSYIAADNAAVILDSTGAAYSGTKENIIESIIDSGTSIETYRSGVLLSNEPYTRSATLTLNNTTLFGSVSTTNTNFLNTKLYGLIITKSNLSARDRSLCETYLKSKVQVLQV